MKEKTQKRTHKRRKYLIHKGFQTRYTIYSILAMVLGNVLFALTLSLLSAEDIASLFDTYGGHVVKTPMVLLAKVLAAHWIFVVIGILLLAVVSIAMTHRIAGPMFHFETILNRMINGSFGEIITLRRSDEGHEIAAKINELNVMLTKKISTMQGLSESLDDHLESADSAANQADADHIRQAAATNKELLDILKGFSFKAD